MSLATLTTGDSVAIPVQLYKESKGNKATFVINGTATVQASIVTSKRKLIILPAVDVVEATIGSNWINSLIIVKFTEAETADISDRHLRDALLEIQVDDGGKLTWFIPLNIVKGTIDQ